MNQPTYTTDQRERNYSARTIEDIARFIVDDPQRIISRIFRSNSNQKYQRHSEYLDEFRQSLAEHIFGRLHHQKFSGCNASLIKWFNGDHERSFSRWLVAYTRNQTASSKSRYFRENSERIDHIESLSYEEQNGIISSTSDPVIDEIERMRNVSLTDVDVIQWRINRHPRFSRYTDEQKGIYLSWFQQSIQKGKKVNIVEFSRDNNLDYRSTVTVIRAINKLMIQHVNEVKKQLESNT